MKIETKLSATAWVALALGLFGCADSQSSQGAGSSLEDALARLDAASHARCEVLVACYPDAQAEGEAACSGPTKDGRQGWSEHTEEQKAQEMACLKKVYAEQPAALTRFIDCFAEEANTVERCIDDSCPADVSACAAKGSDVERRCKDEGAPKLKAVFEKYCGFWDD